MQCYCESNHKKGIYSGACVNTVPYKNHHDWGKEEDYMCEDCLTNCEEK